MKLDNINEDKKPQKLDVTYSTEIAEKILQISEYNKNKKEELAEWYNDIEGLRSYISNPSIAWDYNGKCKQTTNGALHLKELGHEVSYSIKTDKNTGKNYVYIFKLDLKPDEFGLDIPSDLKESKQNITFNNLYCPIKTSYVLSYGEFCRCLYKKDKK